MPRLAKFSGSPGDIRDENSRLRGVGLQEACDEFGATIAQDLVANWDPQQAAAALAPALKAYPDYQSHFGCLRRDDVRRSASAAGRRQMGATGRAEPYLSVQPSTYSRSDWNSCARSIWTPIRSSTSPACAARR